VTAQPDLIPRETTKLQPGAIHIPDWLTIAQQNNLLTLIRHYTKDRWYTPTMLDGPPMKHPIAFLGLAWRPYEYFQLEPHYPLPNEIVALARQALHAAKLSYSPYQPDTGIVNWFPEGSSLGMHQDKSEHSDLIAVGSPIVTISLGDTGIFRLANPYNPYPYQAIELRSGDLLIMHGQSRLAYHGITKILPDTRPVDLNLEKTGRISLTIRQALMYSQR
jgi:DNA oxidative demethylase